MLWRTCLARRPRLNFPGFAACLFAVNDVADELPATDCYVIVGGRAIIGDCAVCRYPCLSVADVEILHAKAPPPTAVLPANCLVLSWKGKVNSGMAGGDLDGRPQPSVLLGDTHRHRAAHAGRGGRGVGLGAGNIGPQRNGAERRHALRRKLPHEPRGGVPALRPDPADGLCARACVRVQRARCRPRPRQRRPARRRIACRRVECRRGGPLGVGCAQEVFPGANPSLGREGTERAPAEAGQPIAGARDHRAGRRAGHRAIPWAGAPRLRHLPDFFNTDAWAGWIGQIWMRLPAPVLGEEAGTAAAEGVSPIADYEPALADWRPAAARS